MTDGIDTLISEIEQDAIEVFYRQKEQTQEE